MFNITFQLGDTTFVVEKKVLSKFLGIFKTNEALKTATSYKIKSNVQGQVFLMFLHAIKSNVFPRVTPEIWNQMIELSEEFKCNELRLYLIQNKQRMTNFSVKKNIRKANTIVDGEQYFNIFHKGNYEVIDHDNSEKLNSNDNENKETKNEDSAQNKNIKLTEDDESSSSYSYSYSSSSYSDESNSDEECRFSDDDDENEFDQDSDVDFDRSDDDLLRNGDDQNSIQKMADQLEKALFGIGKEEENTISTENSEDDCFKFKNKEDVSFVSLNRNHFNKDDSNNFKIVNIGIKRTPRHTFRHLPSKIYQED